jgi:hypothetical protein
VLGFFVDVFESPMGGPLDDLINNIGSKLEVPETKIRQETNMANLLRSSSGNLFDNYYRSVIELLII